MTDPQQPMKDACPSVAVVDGLARVRHAIAGGTAITCYRGPGLLTAGSTSHFEITIELDMPLPLGACLALARRWPSDWGTAQWDDPAAVNFAQAFASTVAQPKPSAARRHAWHPFDHVLMAELQEALPSGATFGMRFGGVPGQSPGFEVQTFIEESSPLSVRLLTGSDAAWQEIARPTIRVQGAAPARLVATAPTESNANLPVDLHLRIEDIWGNPASLSAPLAVTVSQQGHILATASVPMTGWVRIAVAAGASGMQTFTARAVDHPELVTESNPTQVAPGVPGSLLVWGDFHAQSVIGCGVRSIDDYFRHARDFAAADFCSHQANCFLVSGDEWVQTERSTKASNDEGRFITLLGVEWSGASRIGGDHNVYFPGDTAELRRCSHQFVSDKSDIDTDLTHVRDLHAHYAGSDTLIVVHVGGRTADLQYHEPALDRLLEVHSTHATSEWFLFDALRRGYRFGVVAGSDGVDGRPGASHPGRMGVRNVRGGLTAVMLPALNRSNLWKALKDRRCYATTGERIVLSLRTGTSVMGDEVCLRLASGVASPPFDLVVDGTAGIEAIDFFRDDQLLEQRDFLAQDTHSTRRLRLGWRGASAPGNWERARMRWDGQLRIDGARILQVEPWAFDTADEGITTHDGSHVRWRSVTAGDWDGVIVTLDNVDAASLSFATEPITAQCAAQAIDAGGWRQELQSPWRMLEIRRLPTTDTARQVRLSFVDPVPLPGRHAYWVRIRQVDGAYAWSTPIFFDIEIG